MEIVLAEHNFLAPAYRKLLEHEQFCRNNPEEKNFPLLRNARKSKYSSDLAGEGWLEVQAELDYVKGRFAQFSITFSPRLRHNPVHRQTEKDASLAIELNEETGPMEECQCCFGEVPFETMTHCGEGTHLFCLDCARRNAEVIIGNSRCKVCGL